MESSSHTEGVRELPKRIDIWLVLEGYEKKKTYCNVHSKQNDMQENKFQYVAAWSIKACHGSTSD